jgi:peptidoglycan hydrolase-like protein with peptidoglycan-binding domain
MPLSHAAREREKYPDLIIFQGVPYQRKGRWFQSITVKPPHPWSRFRAFDTLEAGVTDYVGLLRTARYTRAWEMLVDGTLVGFVEELEKAGYFTADLHEYLAGMRRSLLDVRGRLLGRPTLKMETRATQDKAQVEFWQREILGFGEDDVDGDFGPDTKKATSEWQKSHHLGGDGEVGPRSWATALPDAEVVL